MKISYPEAKDVAPERWERMMLTPAQYTEMRNVRIEREKNAPKVGEPAPDFEIERLTPEGKRTGEMFRLSSTRGKPVALVFGSYT